MENRQSNIYKTLLDLSRQILHRRQLPIYSSRFSRKDFTTYKLTTLLVIKTYENKGYRAFTDWLKASHIPKWLKLKITVALCSKDVDFTSAKQVLDAVFRGLGKEYEIKSTEHDSFIPGRVARVSYSGKGIAYIGEIHPQVLENFELGMPVAMFELNISELFGLVKE